MNIIFFGANLNCISIVKNDVNLIDNNILCFIDNNKDLQGKLVMGKYLVDSPSNLNNYTYDYIVILSNSLNRNILINQLIDLGVKKDRIIYNWKAKYHTDDDMNIDTTLDILYKDVDYIKSSINTFKKYDDICKQLFNKSLNKEYVNIENKIKLSCDAIKLNYDLFKYEFADIIAPYLRNYDINENVFFEGPYEYNNVIIEKDDFVIDCGANVGLFTSVAANRAFDGKVFSFEPVSKTYDVLMKTSKLYNNVIAIKKGLYDSNEVLDIDLSFYEENQGVSTVVKNLKKENNTYLSEKIEVITLDDFVKINNIQKVDCIKADIEGSERFMIEGAKEVISKFAPKLSICTYHLKDDPEFLENLILKYNPNYIIEHKWSKLYAYVPNNL